MILKKEHVNKILNLENCPVVKIEHNEFSEGDVLIMFNNSPEFGTIQCEVPNSYQSGYSLKRTHLEFPPRGLVNALFINNDTVVFARGI